MSRLHIKDHSSSDFRSRVWGQISVTFMYYRSINLRSSKKVKGWIISRSNKLLSSSLLNTIFNLLKVNVAEFYFNGVYHYQCCELFSKAIFSYNCILTTLKKYIYKKNPNSWIRMFCLFSILRCILKSLLCSKPTIYLILLCTKECNCN